MLDYLITRQRKFCEFSKQLLTELLSICIQEDEAKNVNIIGHIAANRPLTPKFSMMEAEKTIFELKLEIIKKSHKEYFLPE